MRVLQIVKTNEGANWAFTQAEWLFDNGVDIITVLPSLKGGMAEKYIKKGMLVIKGDFSIPVRKPWEIIKRIRTIQAIVKKVQPDIIHSHFFTNIIMLRIALRKSGISRLYQVPGPLHLENWLFKIIEIMLSKDNDYWAGACKKTYNIYHKSGIRQEKIYLAYYGGYGGKACNEYTKSKNILHEEYEISQASTLVGMVSYIYKPKAYLLHTRGLKGHEDFIDAINLVREKYPSVVGVIIGDAWGDSHGYVEKVKKYANDKCKNGIIFTGFRYDMKAIYRELDIVVHPSHSENLGGAAESLAAGVPTISSDVGGFPDIVIDGVTGYTVKIKCPVKLAEAIIKMIQNPDEAIEMSENGKQLVSIMLDIENTGKEILNVYNRIINEDNKR